MKLSTPLSTWPWRVENMKDITCFFSTTPGLSQEVMLLAWKHRAQSPVIKVKTTTCDDARAPHIHIQMIPRSSWSNKLVYDVSDGTTRDYTHARNCFDGRDFDAEKFFAVSMEIFHRPGKEHWPVHLLSMNFMDDMDAIVDGGSIRSFGDVRVRLTGLVTWAHLNGCECTLVKEIIGEDSTKRFLIRLDDGSPLSVKACNYYEINYGEAPGK